MWSERKELGRVLGSYQRTGLLIDYAHDVTVRSFLLAPKRRIEYGSRNLTSLETLPMSNQIAKEKSSGSPRWGQERRIEFIDFRLRWDRTINRGELVRFFNISKQQASSDLALYDQLARLNMQYDKSLKTYKASVDYKPHFPAYDAQNYLNELEALSSGILAPAGSFIGWAPPNDVVRYPSRPVTTEKLLPILWAIKDKNEVQITYQSMRRPKPSARWIAPHALGFDGQRWHTRAWCSESEEFKDFVLSRIQDVHLTRESTVSSEGDAAWHAFIDVIVKPRDGLTDGQRHAIEADFGMVGGQRRLRCREALAFYLVRQMQLDRLPDQPPAAQPLELANRDELAHVISAAQKTVEYSQVSQPT
jgi:hypothetical protein